MAVPTSLKEFLQPDTSRVVEAELERVYSDGWSPGDDHDLMRLLPPDEAAAATRDLRSSWLQLRPEILVLWTDDNSNYAGCYVQGALAPRVVLIEHEEPDETPRFFSPSSFQSAQQVAYVADRPWYEIPCDYPVRDEIDYELLAADRELAMQYLAAFRASPESATLAAHYALQLLPYADTHLVVELLRTDDMWLQERACRVLGSRNYAPAVNALRDVALSGTHNGRIAALVALRSMRSSLARKAVADLRAEIGPEYHVYLR